MVLQLLFLLSSSGSWFRQIPQRTGGVVDSGLPEVPGLLWGPFLDRFLFIVGSCSSCHPLPLGTIASRYLRFPEVSQDSTTPLDQTELQHVSNQVVSITMLNHLQG